MAVLVEPENLLILASKCRMPLVPGDILPRPHLYRELDAWQSRRLTAVQSPPGYGKTMLVASWLYRRQKALNAQGVEVGWVSLDADDDDPRQFMAYVTAALEPVIPAAATTVAQNLRRGQPDLQRAITILLNGISELDGPFLLIVDDYHHIYDEEIHQAFKRVLERGPSNLHVMLLTRQNLRPVLGHLNDIGGLRVLGADDLRFVDEEISIFVEEVLGYERPSKGALSSLAARSDGWITGLTLAAISRPKGGDVDAYAALIHGRNQWLSTYFRSEFLAGQTPEMQTFLLQTSLLDELSAPLCATVTGLPGTDALLEQAVADHLFITPTNDTMTHFVYHDLFRELLRDELEMRCPRTEVVVLSQRAAQWLEENGEIGAALRQYLNAGLYENAIALVERHSLPTILAGDVHRAQHWLNQLQKEDLPLTARLLLDQGWIYLIADRSDTLAFMQSSRDKWRNLTQTTKPDDPYQQEWMTQLAMATHLSNDPEEALTIVTKVGENLSSDSHFLVRGGYHFLKHIAFMNHPAEAREHGLQALRIYEENGWLTGITAMTRAMGQHARLHGHVREALAFNRRALQLVERVERDLTLEAVYIHFELARLFYNLNQIAEARDELGQMILKAETLGEVDLALLGRVIMNLCKRVQGEAARLTPAPDSVGWQDLMCNAMPLRQVYISAWLVRDWILAKEKGKAWQAVRHLPIRLEESPRARQPFEVLTYVSGYLARGRNLPLLKPILAELENMFQEMNFLEYQLRLAVLQAWYWWMCADEKKAAAHMEQALEMIARTGYVRFVLDIPDLRPLLALMQHPALQIFPELSKWLEQVSQDEAFSDQEIKILHLVAQKRKNAEIADELFLSVSTVKWYLWNIYRKLGVKNRRLAVARARELDLIS